MTFYAGKKYSEMDRYGICRRAPLFFLHIPKTAGMSIRGYLENQYQFRDVLPANT